MDLLLSMLKSNVDKRISVNTALKHSYCIIDAENQCNAPEHYYEDMSLHSNDNEWRRLFVEEILKYNTDKLWSWIESGVLDGRKANVLVYGYVRKYIEPLFPIPDDVLNLLYCVCKNLFIERIQLGYWW